MDTSTVPLFDVAPGTRPRARKPRAPKPPSPTDTTFRAWRELFQQRTGRDLNLPSGAAWGEVKRHCKRLATLVPDPDVREAFLDAWLRTRDRYVVDRDFPLRLALRDETFQKLLREAARQVAERRRVGAAVPEAPVVEAPVKRLGRPWCVQVHAGDGRLLGAAMVHALDKAGAERAGRRALARAMQGDIQATLSAAEADHA